MRLKNQLKPVVPPLVLYALLFQPDLGEFASLLTAPASRPSLPFSAKDALAQTFAVYIPAIALLWALTRPQNAAPGLRHTAPAFRPADLADAFFCLLALAAIGAAVALLSLFSPEAGMVPLESLTPDARAPLCLMLCAAAVLEELFFRRYLIAAFEKAGAPVAAASLASVLLFTLPHVWEGVFGLLNAFLAGLFCTSVYLLRRRVFPVAAAHALYNVAAFLVSAP
jgi:membrane protease YdiL (CAAX protease family)